MGVEKRVKFLTPEQARDLAALAERTRRELSHFAGQEVTYDVDAVRLLDEWIDRRLRRSPRPSGKARMPWVCFLGEMFRRRHEGWWALRDGALVVVCPTNGGGRHEVDVAGQIERRVDFGMAESLAYFYNVTRIELKIG